MTTSRLRQVLNHIQQNQGPTTLGEIAQKLSLTREMTASMVEYWIHRGQLGSSSSSGSGCSGCPSLTGCSVPDAQMGNEHLVIWSRETGEDRLGATAACENLDDTAKTACC